MSDQNNNNQNNNSNKFNEIKDAVLKDRSWKMYVSLVLYAILGLALGYIVAKGVLYIVNRPNNNTEITSTETDNTTGVKKFEGTVSSVFEGENKGDVSIY